MWRLGAVPALFVAGMVAAETEPYAGVFGMDGTGGMGCDENPMRLMRQGAAGPFVMAWARPVATGDGSEASELIFREGRMQGRWLYLTNVGQDDLALLQFSEDFGRFVLMAKVVKHWTGADDSRAVFRRCPAFAS